MITNVQSERFAYNMAFWGLHILASTFFLDFQRRPAWQTGAFIPWQPGEVAAFGVTDIDIVGVFQHDTLEKARPYIPIRSGKGVFLFFLTF